jgi:hypothetical protein
MNKAERSATESVEPRAESKGNAAKPHRTHSRVSATEALERVSSKSSPRSSTTLSIEHLEAAFSELQENAQPPWTG